VVKASGPHDIYAHGEKTGHIAVPRGRGDLPLGTARSIARAAGWLGRRDQTR
jgi:predicted RNA binding protein YcfA (HicA-like mRNA interferase family)